MNFKGFYGESFDMEVTHLENLTSEVVSLTKSMRTAAYIYGDIQKQCDQIPFGGSIRESIGPFPEFILKGRFCTRSLKGLCSPCFYSRLPVHEIDESEFNLGYEEQVEYIIRHFRELVIENQVGKVAHNFVTDKDVYGMVCTPTGSYFDPREYPVNIRKNNLKKLTKTADSYNCEIILHIESHAEDVINYFKDPDFEELSLLHQLHARVLLGFESVNEISRNVIYAKQLNIKEFSTAVSILKSNDFPVGAFVFAGLFALTDEETISDTKETLCYLKSINVSPVLMFANTQKYTIPDVLLSIGKYKLLDPRTVYYIVKNTIEIFGCEMNSDIDPWFIADPKGGPPDPNYHIFNASTSTSCTKCANKIYEAIEELRISKDKETFLMAEQVINHDECLYAYSNLLKKQLENSVENSINNRIFDCIKYSRDFFSYYCLKENPWIVKAELLCFGLKISEAQMEILSINNPFIREKGFVNATHILFKKVLINVCVSESFCKKSPYSLYQKDNVWYLKKDEVVLDKIDFLPFPNWVYKEYKGVMIGSVVRPHSNRCVSLWPSFDCKYVKEKKGCRFCSLTSINENQMEKLEPELVANLVKIVLDYNPEYEVNLSGGTCSSPECAIEYLSEICNKIVLDCGHVPISVECAPPKDIQYLKKLKESGATAFVTNIEIYNEELRKEICPGKGEITNDVYFETLKSAVRLFGEGNVSSVLIVGIQPKEDIINACKIIINIGAVPTLIPFKPLDNTSMSNHGVTDSVEYVELSRMVTAMLKKKKLVITNKSGCAACGACSIESNLMEVYL